MAIKSNYSVSVSEVSPQMITQAEDILNQFSNDPLKDNSLLEQLIWIIEVYITILKTAVLWQIVRQLWK